MIECTVNGHKYQTAKLLTEDFLNLGAMLEEKVFPFFTCFMACIANDLSDAEQEALGLKELVEQTTVE